MSDRVVKVSLVANVSNYVAGMEQAKRSTKEVTDEAEQARIKAQAQSQALTQVGAGLVAVGALAMVGIGVAVKKFADFDQAMSNVSAVTMETADNMSLLRDAALDAGARTVFSATEAANAIEELGKAGVSTQDILSGGLNASLDLAAAGGLGVADAAGIAAVAMKTFNLRGSDMSHVADLLAAGAGKAMGDVTDLSMALRQSGQVAASTGLSIEETTAALSAFASQGLIGSDAGTSFKAMLQRLTPQSKEAADKMQALGISAYDASGNFIGLEALAGNLQDSLKGLTVEQRNSAFATIFGSDAVRAANVLYTEGAKGIGEWVKQVDDSGYAAEVASRRLDNLKGDFEKLTGALDSAFIQSGSGANDVLRGLTQFATEAVDAFTELPNWLQQATFWIGGIAGAVTVGAGAFMLAVPKVVEYKLAIEQLGTTAQRVSGMVGTAFKVMSAVAVVAIATEAVNALGDAMQEKLSPSAEETANSVTTATDAVSAFAAIYRERMPGVSDGMANARDTVNGLGAALDDAANSSWWDKPTIANQEHLKTWEMLGTEISKIAATDLPAAAEQFNMVAEASGLTRDQMIQMIESSPDLKKELTSQATALGMAAEGANLLDLMLKNVDPSAKNATESAKQQAEALQEVSGAADDASGQIANLDEQIRNFGSATLDANEANRQFQQAVDDATASLQANGATLDITTQQGRDNQASLDAMAKAANDSAASNYTLSGSESELQTNLANSRQQLIDSATQFGMTKEEAERYADSVLATPQQVKTTAVFDTSSASKSLSNWLYTLNNTPVSYGGYGTGLGVLKKASGGILPGAPSNRDNMFIHAASGEFVVRASQTAIPANRRALEYINRGGVINGYANGGMVQPNYVASSGGSGNSYMSSGDTFNASFNVQATPGLPLEEQVFTAARRLKSRQKVRR